MKVIPKLLIVLLIIGFLNVVIPVNNEKVYASAALTEVETQKPTDMSGGELSKVVATLLGFLQIASALIAVVMIAVTGFRYIIETPEMKNELKKSMVPIIAGILLVFFAVSIAKFFVGMFEGNSGNSGNSSNISDRIEIGGSYYVLIDGKYVPEDQVRK